MVVGHLLQVRKLDSKTTSSNALEFCAILHQTMTKQTVKALMEESKPEICGPSPTEVASKISISQN